MFGVSVLIAVGLASGATQATPQPVLPQQADIPAAPQNNAAATALGSAPSTAFPPAANVDEAFLHLQAAVGVLNEASLIDPAARDRAQVLNGQVNTLQDLFARRGGAPVSRDYVASLDLAANSLAEAAGGADPTMAAPALVMIERDLRIKIASARARFGATGNAPETIPVSVTARRAGQPAIGYFIRAVSALRWRETPIYRFNDPTDPRTSARLVPGVYVFHAYDPHGGEVQVLNAQQDVGLEADSASLTVVIQ